MYRICILKVCVSFLREISTAEKGTVDVKFWHHHSRNLYFVCRGLDTLTDPKNSFGKIFRLTAASAILTEARLGRYMRQCNVSLQGVLLC